MPGLTHAARGGILRRLGAGEDGAVAVIVAITMVVVLGMAALVIDIGGVESRKTMLQNAADAAAMALAQECADSMASTTAGCDPQVQSNAPTEALGLARDNVNDRDVEVVGQPAFTISDVTVVVSSAQQNLFASIFGTPQTPVTATATARWAKSATVLPLTLQACEFPSTTPQDVTLRSDPLALGQALSGDCGALSGILGLLVPGWLTNDCRSYDIGLVTVITGTLQQVLPPDCTKAFLDSLVGHDVLLPVYSNPLGELLGCGVLSIILPQCQVEGYALVRLAGYDFQSLDADVAVAGVGVTLNTGELVDNPPQQCVTQNTQLLGATVNLGAPLCQGIQGTFQQLVTPTQAQQLASQTGGVKLIA